MWICLNDAIMFACALWLENLMNIYFLFFYFNELIVQKIGSQGNLHI